ncbi:MAG: hypothetical protein ACN4E2_06435 [Nitrospinota bacterium]
MSVDKRAVLESFLKSGDTLISITPNSEDVKLPTFLKSNQVINFVLGSSSTPRLKLDTWGVEASMRFGSSKCICRFPWDSIIQMSSKSAVIQFVVRDDISKPAQALNRDYDTTQRIPKLRIVQK